MQEDDEHQTTTPTDESTTATPTVTDFGNPIRDFAVAIHEGKYTESDIDSFLFANDPFDKAFDESKRQVKILMSVLYDSNEEYQVTYCKELILSDFVVELLRHNFILWFGNINNTEHMQTLSNMMARNPQLLATTGSEEKVYPVTTLVSYLDNSLSIISILEGIIDIDTMIMKLLNVVELYVPLLENQREGKFNRESEIQQELMMQDFEYEEALKKDQERERLRREREEQQMLEEIMEKSRLEEKQRRRQQQKDNLKPEPDKSTDQSITTIRFKLPDSSTVSRRFNIKDKLTVLFDYLSAEKDVDSDEVKLVSNFPHITLEYDTCGDATIEEKKLFPQGSLHVQTK